MKGVIRLDNSTNIKHNTYLLREALEYCRESDIRHVNISDGLTTLNGYLSCISKKYKPLGLIIRFLKDVIDDTSLLKWWILHDESENIYVSKDAPDGVFISTPSELLNYYFSKKE